MLSYERSLAERLSPTCDVGFLKRPERVVLFIIGTLSPFPGSNNFFANRMPAVLWVLAVGSYWTFAHRMYHTWIEVNKTEISQPSPAEIASSESTTADIRPKTTLAHKAG